MRIVSLSDSHGLHHKMTSPIPDGDVLIHAGDISNVGEYVGIEDFANWFSSFPHKHKIVVAGNHDAGLQNFNRKAAEKCLTDRDIIYLRDSEYIIDGIKFYGSPWTPKFLSWSFMLYTEAEAKEVWSKIPDNINVLIAHGQPYWTHGILDFSQDDQIHVGCKELYKRITSLSNLKLFIGGHIHEGYGQEKMGNVTYINPSICNLKYEPINAPIVIEIDENKNVKLV
jgi:Icc-related predicted phosphoesterase